MRKNTRSLLTFIIILIVSLSFSTQFIASDGLNQEQAGFVCYDHELTQGFINQSAQDRRILYWIQVSDIHLSMAEKDKENRENFEHFCNTTIPIISPAFVLSSGDNVNGPLGMEPKPDQHYQSEEEYQFFRNTLDNYGLNSSFYYSGIGNHETYNIGLDRELFFKYMQNSTKYYFDVNAPSGTYRFVCLDTTQHVGLGNPFDYWGELKGDRLNEIESLLHNTPDKVDQIVFWGHQPVHHIYSGRSDSGKTFKDLLIESGAAIYLCGHLHTDNTYWNHGAFTELECPVFRDESKYRILAIDNGLYSFSDLVSEQWPAVVITNPISNLFYNLQTDFSKMRNGQEIRVLIFDPNPITEAYVEIDGLRIGDLIDQGNNLWALSYDPEVYTSGNHDLTAVVKSSSGTISQAITFNMEDFNPVQTDGFNKYLIALDFFLLLSILLGLCFFLAFFFTIGPKLYYSSSQKRKRKLLKITPEELNNKSFFRRHLFKKWIQAAKLPTTIWLLLIFVPTYLLIGPVFIGPMIDSIWGGVWIYGIFVIGEHVLDFYSFIWAGLFLILFRIVINFAIRTNQPQPNKLRYIPLLLYFAIWAAVIWFYSGYFTLGVMLINPMIISSIAIPLIVIWKLKNSNR